MATTYTTLYPPQIDTFAPAFLMSEGVVLTLRVSPYDSFSDLSKIHLSLVNMSTNENVLADTYGTGMKVYQITNFNENLREIYLTISGSDIINGWNANSVYKAQVRFETPGAIGSKYDNSYFSLNQKYFSEWSTVCILKPIYTPEISLTRFSNLDTTTDEPISFNKGIIIVSGSMSFYNENVPVSTAETLQSYSVEVLSENEETVYFTSDIQYTGNSVNKNSIYYELDMVGTSAPLSETLILRINYTTRNQYKSHQDFLFMLADYIEIEEFDPQITITMDNEEKPGIAIINIINSNEIYGTLYVRRSSSKSNFKKWETIYEAEVNSAVNITVNDNTVGSLVWYRYYVQLKNSKGAMSKIYYSQKILPDFFYAMISRKDKAIALRFNDHITTMKPVVNRQKIDTLGGKYPKFAENAVLNYKQFNITGTISSQEDINSMFISKSAYFGSEYENYNNYIVANEISEDYDYFWEREFREELVKWLNDGEPKLYRSKTEGLMCIMLTDISLTPNQTLSRRLYDFSATAYEIADGNSIATLDDLGIYDITKIAKSSGGGGGGDYTTYYIPFQLYNVDISIFNKGNIINYVKEIFKDRYQGVLSNKDPKDFSIKNVKIWFNTEPNVYSLTEDGSINAVPNRPTAGMYNDIQYTENDTIKKSNYKMGYVFATDLTKKNSYFFVNERGFYQIPSDIELEQLFFPYPNDTETIPNVNIEFILKFNAYSSSSSVISSVTVVRHLIGQEGGRFDADYYLGDRIRKKYSYSYASTEGQLSYNTLQWWRGISVDCDPYAIVRVRWQGEDAYTSLMVGQTGVLNFIEDMATNNLCFAGRRMTRRNYTPDKFEMLDEWEYGVSPGTFAALEDINFPQRNVVYHVGENWYIYYIDEQWYPVEEWSENPSLGGENGTPDVASYCLAKVPINALVNYTGTIIRIDT